MSKNQKVTFYTSNSELCREIQKSLDAKGVTYKVVDNVKTMLESGIFRTPVLQVGSERLLFVDDIKEWISKQ